MLIAESVCKGGIESTDASFASEGNDIWGGGKVPVFITPHFASATNAGSSFINNEGNLVVQGDLSKSFEVVWSGDVVFERSNRLDNDCSNVLFSLSSLLDDISDSLKASIFFSSVFMLVFSDWVLDLGERSSWPVKGWGVLEVGLWIAA